MNRTTLILFVIALALFIFSIGLLSFISQTLDSYTVYTSVTITENSAGFDVNSSALTFGNVPQSSSSTRSIIFENSYGAPVRLFIVSEGTINSLLNHQNPIQIDAQQTQTIDFSIETDSSTEQGFYEGLVTFTVRPAF